MRKKKKWHQYQSVQVLNDMKSVIKLYISIYTKYLLFNIVDWTIISFLVQEIIRQ